MPRSLRRGARGIALVAITYVYFLIFAQFAFLGRLAELGLAGGNFKLVMGAMAIGGILASLLAPGLAPFASPAAGLRLGFLLCGVSALLTLAPLQVFAAIIVAFLIGAGLGLLTVTLVTHLRDWTGSHRPLLKVGIGVGIGYFLCNVPFVFNAKPVYQAILAAVLCGAGLLVAAHSPEPAENLPEFPHSQPGFLLALAAFAALVWLDSAAFYIIQHQPALKAGTWMGTAHLWTNACIHLAAALASAYLLGKKGLQFVLSAAVLALGAACILLLDPARALPASLFYPAGVSLYSVALVAWPSFLASTRSPAQRARQAAWIYAVAGWIGSALGIGMGQNLGRVPPAFVALAGAVVLLPALFHLAQSRTRELALTFAVVILALVFTRILRTHPAPQPPPSLSPVAGGRAVYISEGCIHCHSQYVRPNSPDVLLWGPAQSLDEIHRQQPPLIGNRRQGPDLAQVGARRSPLWLKAHLFNPLDVSGSSIMPSYSFLFSDARGDDLVAYLASLRSGDPQQRIAAEKSWIPSASALANAQEGEQLYRKFCATCHDSDGATRRQWQSGFRELPANLFTGPFRYLDPSGNSARLAQIAKFGIPGTDMPGHEYLSDRQIASLTLWITQHQPARSTTGDAR